MGANNLVNDVYQAVDSADSGRLTSFMTDDSSFRFSNMPAVKGKHNIKAFLDGFYRAIKDIKHTDIESWQIDDTWFAIGFVSYTRHDDSVLKVPFSVLLTTKEGLISD